MQALFTVGKHSGLAERGLEFVVYPQLRPRGFHPLEYSRQPSKLVESDRFVARAAPAAEISNLWLNKCAAKTNFLFTVVAWAQFHL